MPIPIKPLPPLEYLNELFIYDEVEGKVLRKISRNYRCSSGSEAGTIHHTGRRVINIDGELFQTSRIAYALYHGVDPYPHEVDHDDRNKLNNSITNLILTDRSGNCKNRDMSASIERWRRLAISRRKQVEITFPNGEVVVTKSIKEAADLLSVDQATITNRASGKYIGGKLKDFQITIKQQ
jgi:hypothetical protein